MEGIIPKVFDKVLDLAAARKNILLVGPAGCGKTTIGFLVAKALNLRFSGIVCTVGMSETHILGKETHNITKGTTKYQSTEFVECYETGGLYLFDELDGADPNMLLCVNSALSNGYLMLPARLNQNRANRHADFVCCATANTTGKGANRTYSGRNQLDEATLDRFRIGMVEVDYDKDVEKQLCPDDELLQKCWAIRAKIESNNLKGRIMSTRFIAEAYDMLSRGWKLADILTTYFVGWGEDERRKVTSNY